MPCCRNVSSQRVCVNIDTNCFSDKPLTHYHHSNLTAPAAVTDTLHDHATLVYTICMYVCMYLSSCCLIYLSTCICWPQWTLMIAIVQAGFMFPQTSLLKAVVLSLPLQPLDYEKKPSYTIEIQVQNTQEYVRFVSSGPKDVATVRLAVDDVDEPPVFKKASYLYEVKEDVAVGTVVGSVSAMDPDRARSIVK